MRRAKDEFHNSGVHSTRCVGVGVGVCGGKVRLLKCWESNKASRTRQKSLKTYNTYLHIV